MTADKRVSMLEPPVGKVSMVLDTDTYNEVDDQFAVAYAVRAAQAGDLTLEAIHAAPFENKGYSHAEGMELSYQEIHRVLDLLGSSEYKDKVFRGSDRALNGDGPVRSDAAENLIRLAKDDRRQGPLYVVAIGAATNVASALMLAPEIAERIVVVWLAGNVLHWPHVREFNVCQDRIAARYLLDCGVPLMLMPAYNVVAGLCTTVYELEHYLDGKSSIGSYLVRICREYAKERENPGLAWSKVIWDIAGPAWLLHPEWFETRLVSTPILTDDLHWASDSRRPLMRIADFLYRDPIFRDVFNRLTC